MENGFQDHRISRIRIRVFRTRVYGSVPHPGTTQRRVVCVEGTAFSPSLSRSGIHSRVTTPTRILDGFSFTSFRRDKIPGGEDSINNSLGALPDCTVLAPSRLA